MSESSNDQFINILIAEDNDVSREMMGSVLRTQGYNILGAEDGQEAIDIITQTDVDMAFVDINMAPKGGFEFAEYLLVQGIKLPVVIVTGDDSSDILMKANNLGITQILHKPVDPERLVQIARRVLKRQGLNPDHMGVERHNFVLSPEDLLKKAIQMAQENVQRRLGGPYAAVVADQDGRIIGEGVNRGRGQVDPMAHAEVMAIRQASEHLKSPDLSSCALYCASEPTMIGKALIVSVGIQKVYYGLSVQEVSALRENANMLHEEMKKYMQVDYVQLCHDEAQAMFAEAMKASS